jgi:AraC-like DNA-binding protein
VANTERLALRTADIGEVIDAVSHVYCPHELKIRGATRGAPSSFEVIRGGAQPIVTLRYAAPVLVDACDFRGLMLMQSCTEGTANMTQGGVRTECHRNQTVPLSPGVETQLAFDGNFAQRSVRVDIASLEALCSRRLNAPLERPLRFEFRPFSSALEQAWSQGVSLIVNYERSGIVLPKAAAASLDEFLLTLLLEQHPHNYSEELHGGTRGIAPRLVREAEHFMRTGGPEISVTKIAARLGVSMRSLEAGFREWRNATPTQVLRKVRLEAARAALLAADAATSVTSAALGSGFFHLARFSAYYKNEFGEMPGQTLRRTRAGGQRV